MHDSTARRRPQSTLAHRFVTTFRLASRELRPAVYLRPLLPLVRLIVRLWQLFQRQAPHPIPVIFHRHKCAVGKLFLAFPDHMNQPRGNRSRSLVAQAK